MKKVEQAYMERKKISEGSRIQYKKILCMVIQRTAKKKRTRGYLEID